MRRDLIIGKAGRIAGSEVITPGNRVMSAVLQSTDQLDRPILAHSPREALSLNVALTFEYHLRIGGQCSYRHHGITLVTVTWQSHVL